MDNKTDPRDVAYMMLLEQIKIDLAPYIEEVVSRKVASKTEVILEALYDLPLNVEQVARLTGEDIQTVYKWRRRGQIEFDKYHGRIHTNLREIIKKLMGGDPLR